MKAEVDFEIDKLTNSIENAISGEVFNTVVTLLKQASSREIKTREWAFNWKALLKEDTSNIYKLTTVNNPLIIQGLIALDQSE